MIRSFFESCCGGVNRLHVTRFEDQDAQVAFVEFTSLSSAELALTCGGARLKARRGELCLKLHLLILFCHRHLQFESVLQRHRFTAPNQATVGTVVCKGLRRRMCSSHDAVILDGPSGSRCVSGSHQSRSPCIHAPTRTHLTGSVFDGSSHGVHPGYRP